MPRKKINRQQENNAIINNEVDENLLTQKVNSSNHEATEFLDSDYDANYFYKVDRMSIEETKEKIDSYKRLNTKRKNHIGLKIEMI